MVEPEGRGVPCALAVWVRSCYYFRCLRHVSLLRLVDMGKISRVLVVRIHIVLSVSCYCLACLCHCVASRESWPSHSLKPCRVLGFVDAYV